MKGVRPFAFWLSDIRGAGYGCCRDRDSEGGVMCGEHLDIELADSDFARPTCAEVIDVLRAQGSLLVHFSGYPPMTSGPNSLQYPSDLRKVIDNKCQSGIPCSTIKIGDGFDPKDSNSNSAGCVGLIISPDSDRSIIAAESYDIGSNWNDGNREYPPNNVRKHIDHNTLMKTIYARSASSYNEWGVKDFKVVGVFATDPLKVWREPDNTTFREIQATFCKRRSDPTFRDGA